MDRKYRKQAGAMFAVVYIALIILMIVGTFNDLAINKALFSYQNPFGLFLANWGMTPVYCVQLFAYCALFAAYHPLDEAFDIAQTLFPFFKLLRSNRLFYKLLWLLHKVMYVAFIYGAFQGANEMLNALHMNVQDILVQKSVAKTAAIAVWTIVRFAVVAIVIFMFSRLDKKNIKALEFSAVVGLIVYYIFWGGGLEAMKLHFHRIRFREMIGYSHGMVNDSGYVSLSDNIPREWIADTDFSWFTRWYQIGQDNGVHWADPKSFPSGHTSAAGYSMLIIPLFMKNQRTNNLVIPSIIISVGYTACVGLSRLLRGAHYLTDVTAATIIMLTLILAVTGILTVIQNKSNSKLSK